MDYPKGVLQPILHFLLPHLPRLYQVASSVEVVPSPVVGSPVVGSPVVGSPVVGSPVVVGAPVVTPVTFILCHSDNGVGLLPS